MNKCIFLDRDGVINRERGEYTFNIEDFDILPGVIQAIRDLKSQGYLIIIITNQAGISRGFYKTEDVLNCHSILQEECDNLIDDIYFCPYHPEQTLSIARKPDTLMFEKAIAKYNIDINRSWMIGDKERDITPAIKMGLGTVLVSQHSSETNANHVVKRLFDALPHILQ